LDCAGGGADVCVCFTARGALLKVNNIWRFQMGQAVWVRDFRSPHGVKIVQATVREQHEHGDRHPWYPNGEGYSLDGELWWDCYPGCRVFATQEEAKSGRLPKNEEEAKVIASRIATELSVNK
jgi:hypothetical protein